MKKLWLLVFCWIGSLVQARSATIDNIQVYALANHNEKFAFTNSFAATATICWTTSAPTTAYIKYGTTQGDLTFTSRFDPSFNTQHCIRLQYKILEGTTYYFQIVAKTEDGTITNSTIESFTTPSGGSASEWWEVAHDQWYKKSDWNSQTRWINSGTVFRLHLNLDQAVAAAWLHMTRFERYKDGIKLFVNGTYVGFWSFGFSMKTFDIGQYLQQGENVIVVGTDADEPISMLCEGQIELADGSTQLIQTKAGLWRKATNPQGSWGQTDFDDSQWDLAPSGADPTLESAPYSPLMVADLPGSTPGGQTRLDYTAAMSRRDRLAESELLRYRQLRPYLGLNDTDHNIAETLALEAFDQLFDLAPILETAKSQIKSDDDAGAVTSLTNASDLLDQAELRAEVINNLLAVSAQIDVLNGAFSLAAGAYATPALMTAAAEMDRDLARTLIGGNDLNGALSSLQSAANALDGAARRVSCAGDFKLSERNGSQYSPFGWIRIRGSYTARVFNSYFDQKECSINTGEAPAFASLPSDIRPSLRDSTDFLSPFLGVNVSGTAFSLSSGMTHIAVQIGATVITPTSDGMLYNAGMDGSLTANWLLLWDEASSNRVYLVLMEKNPDSLAMVDNQIAFSNSAGVGKLFIYRLYAAGESLNGNTGNISDWKNGLPFDVQTDVDTWSQLLTRIPTGYTEIYSENQGVGTITMKYLFEELNDAWATVSTPYAPVPNALSFARANGYAGITVDPMPEDTGYDTANWGPFEICLGSDTLSYDFPLMNPSPLNGVNETIARAFPYPNFVANSGFNAIRGQIPIMDEMGDPFTLRDGWETSLTDALSAANDVGLTAIFFIWNNSGTDDGLQGSPTNQDAFVEAWRQVAVIAKDFDVVYDLTNEPSFTDVGEYNDVMSRTATAIRGEDSDNPITIEGFKQFSQTFEGMTHPGTSDTWFQFHPYANTYHHNMSSIDKYYPGFVMEWWSQEYVDRDLYVEERWLPAVKAMLADDRIVLMNGEYGFQSMPSGVDEALARDSLLLARQFAAHQIYFVTLGWSFFDLYAGVDDTYQERSNIIDIIAQLNQPPTDPLCTFLEDLAAWLNGNAASSCGTAAPDILDFVQFVTNDYTCQTP